MEVTRTASGRPWRLVEAHPELALAIAQRHGLPEVVGRLLAARGLDVDGVGGFIEPRLRDWLPEPSHLLDLDRAVERLAVAVARREPVGVIGDYDVDGATATALVVRFLRSVGVATSVEIPDRLSDGYGASAAAFDRLAASGCRLVLLLDNGTTAFAPIAHARRQGQEVIVVDHHTAEAELPDALAVVNPNRRDQASPLTHLAACGLTFVVLAALRRRLRDQEVCPELLGMLDLVALGTVCDVVPLTGLNRAFVIQGLKVALHGGAPGLRALAAIAGIGRLTDAWQLGYALGPRINAGGRLGASALGASLLTTDDPAEAALLASRLDELNRERQTIERAVLEAADAAARQQREAGRRVLVASGAGWHQGVVGIVASRLVERLQRPVFVLGIGPDGLVRGSARSVAGVDLGATVIAARRAGLLVEGGGHAMAAGVTLRAPALAAFMEFLEDTTSGLPGDPARTGRPLLLDGLVSVAGASLELARTLARLAPFGQGNPEPVWAIEAARIVERRPLKNGHLGLTLTDAGGGRLRAVAFRCAETALGRLLLEADGPIRIAGRLKAETWQGSDRVALHLEDAAPA